MLCLVQMCVAQHAVSLAAWCDYCQVRPRSDGFSTVQTMLHSLFSHALFHDITT